MRATLAFVVATAASASAFKATVGAARQAIRVQRQSLSSLQMGVREDIEKDISTLVKEKGDCLPLLHNMASCCGPILVRLSWHDAGVYSTGKLTGGCPNAGGASDAAVMRFTDGGEGTFGANAGLPDVAVGLLEPISEKYVANGDISNADLWTLAANVAIKVRTSCTFSNMIS
eukprot:6212691-Pleurochrysis_carterae.AAC.2